MGMHKTWSEGKKKVKAKDWESKLKFKDDLGGALDKFEKKGQEVDKLMKTVMQLLKDQAHVADAISKTAKTYTTKIDEGFKNHHIDATDKDVLTTTLKDVIKNADSQFAASQKCIDATATFIQFASEAFQ